jgi:hypothetical protein
MAEKFNREPEETDEVFIDADYNPLSEPINEKPYTKPNVTINPDDLKGEIPEPDFTPPPMGSGDYEDEPPLVKKEKPQQAPRPERKPQPTPLNPEMEGAKKSENRKSAKMLAEMSMQGYELLHQLGNMAIPISQKQINKMVEKGVNLQTQLPYDEMGNSMSISEFIEEYNDQNKQLLTVDEDFKQEVMPVLTEVYEKRGLGATPEQKLAFLVAKDVGVKVMIVSSAIAVQKSMINSWIAIHQNNQFQAPATPVQPNQPRQSAPTEQETYTETYVVDEYDPLSENLTIEEMEQPEDPMSVNYQVEQMTNPDGQNSRKRGRPKKNK